MGDLNGETKLEAIYTSPKHHKAFTTPLRPISDANRSTTDKTAYLSEIRKHVSRLQDDMNAFLTQKMEEDKAAQQMSGLSSKAIDEDKEEEMYGEEDPEKEG